MTGNEKLYYRDCEHLKTPTTKPTLVVMVRQLVFSQFLTAQRTTVIVTRVGAVRKHEVALVQKGWLLTPAQTGIPSHPIWKFQFLSLVTGRRRLYYLCRLFVDAFEVREPNLPSSVTALPTIRICADR